MQTESDGRLSSGPLRTSTWTSDREPMDRAVFGSGNSKFFVNPDTASYRTLPPHVAKKPDPTLYLVNSTFYRDRVPDLVVPVPRNQPDPMPIVPVGPPSPPTKRSSSAMSVYPGNGEPAVYIRDISTASDPGSRKAITKGGGIVGKGSRQNNFFFFMAVRRISYCH